MPVAVTTPTAAPFETVVPANIMFSFACGGRRMGTHESSAMYGMRHGTLPGANIMFSLAWMRTLFATGSVCFITVSDSPVKAPSSVRTVVVLRRRMRTSAGT